MIFYLVRHGQTDWNTEKRMQGHMNIPMNEVGLRQISSLAERLAEEGIRFDRLIASPLDRAGKSAEIIAEKTGFKKEIIIDDDLIERSCGTLEGEVWSPELDLDDPKYKVEPIPDLYKRAQKALDKYKFAEDERVMLVSHGAILTAVRAVLSGYKYDFFDRTVPVIQGNVMCCERKENGETTFYNLFKPERSSDDKRPELDVRLDGDTFRNYYYLKAELVDFCRKNDLPTSGGKTELTDRIACFLDTGART